MLDNDKPINCLKDLVHGRLIMKKIFGTVLILFILTLLVGCAATFHEVAKKHDIKTLKEMVYAGTNINKSKDGGTALMWESYYCDIEAIKFLLKHGADINATGMMEQRALHWAVMSGCHNAIELLIDNGANIDALDKMGGSPLGYAAYYDQGGETLKLLIERGADQDIALNYLLKIRELTGAQRVQIEGRKVEKEKARIASFKNSQTPSIKTDIDEIPIINSALRDNAYAIVIGIENYRSIPKSDYSRNDATLVKSYLKALGFRERNIDFITDEKATRTDIEKSLEVWLPYKAKKGSTVIVYFSGHGAPEPYTGEAYLVPYDGDPNYLPVTGYSLKRLYEKLGELEAEEIIVVLDSCFSGSGGRSVLAKGARPLVMMAPTVILSSNIAVLSATQSNQISTSSPDKGLGVFTYYFLKAIKKGNVTLAEI